MGCLTQTPSKSPSNSLSQKPRIKNIQVESGARYQLGTALPNQTIYGDKRATSQNFLTFTLSAAANVIVAFDSRTSAIPDWLNTTEWTWLNQVIETNDATFKLYQQPYVAGPVTLGGNFE